MLTWQHLKEVERKEIARMTEMKDKIEEIQKPAQIWTAITEKQIQAAEKSQQALQDLVEMQKTIVAAFGQLVQAVVRDIDSRNKVWNFKENSFIWINPTNS